MANTHQNYYLGSLVLAGIALSQTAHAAVINWGANFNQDALNVSANFVDMYITPLTLIVGVFCAVIGIGAFIGYLKR